MDSSEVSPVVLDSAQCGPTDLAGGVDSVYGLVLGQTAFISELLPAYLTRKYVPAFLQWVHIVQILPET